MKNVIILGANGRTAKQIIPRLLEQRDVKLTLFLRHADRLKNINNAHVRLVEGDANHLDDLRNALQGQDIVISTMGGMDLGDKTANVVSVMEEQGIQRLIAISAGGIYNELPEPFNTWDKQIVGQTRPVNLKTAEVIEKSTLTYTILRPVWLTNKLTEEFQLTHKGEIYKGTETSRASIARLVADIIDNPMLYANENLGISQPNTDGDKPVI